MILTDFSLNKIRYSRVQHLFKYLRTLKLQKSVQEDNSVYSSSLEKTLKMTLKIAKNINKSGRY